MRHVLTTLIGTLTVAGLAAASPQDQARPVFRAAVDRVTVTTIVHDRKGRPVTDLHREDFELLDAGRPRAIAEFRSEATTLTLALLVDFSGSMGLKDRREAAKSVAADIMERLQPGDKIGLFVFDKTLHEVAPFGSQSEVILEGLESIRPFGVTSLFDAIAEGGRMLAAHAGTHRAIVALTDGADNASRLTAARVSAIASSVDVPVYLLIVSTPGDQAGRAEPDDTGLNAAQLDQLSELARWTGGRSVIASSPTRSREAARDIVSELRHQYVIAFAPDPRPGWHGIEIRTRAKDLVVRARSGYIVESQPDGK